MAIKSFSQWLNEAYKDIFGFDSDSQRQQMAAQTYGNNHYNPYNTQLVIEELARFNLGAKQPHQLFNDSLQWGDGSTGSIRVDVTPFGSTKLIIRKLSTNLEGTETWICKRIVPFNQGIMDAELDMAHLVLKELKIIEQEGLDSAANEYDRLENMVLSIASRIKRRGPLIFIYEGIRKVDDNYYIIHFGYRGQGVEAPDSQRCEQFHINLEFSRKTGLIHCWGNEIRSPTAGHLWTQGQAEWNEYFTPSQSQKEIEQAILNALSTY